MGLFFKKNRPPHLGKYPMEKIKRVDHPTTRIDAQLVPRVPFRGSFFNRPFFGDLGERAKRERPRFVAKYPLSDAMGEIMRAIVPLQGGETAKEKAPETDDPDAMARHLKSLAYFLDMDIVGICEIPDYAWYSHDAEGNVIEPYHSHAIVMLIDQGFETMEGASGDDWISGTQSYRAYLRGAEVGSVIAGYIRRLGYGARCQSAADGHVLQIPLMLWAGLGELSRIGELVLNPFIGPRSKTVVVTTNLPLTCDKPIDFGLQKFCGSCYKCARECPCGAIPFGDKIVFNGYETWKPDVENCAKYRITNQKGAACGRCMKTCPLNKVVSKDGALVHRVANWLALTLPFLKPLLIPLAVRFDDVLGYGKRIKEQKWWLDHETVDGQIVRPRGVNARGISPNKPNPKNHKVALYPAQDLPPGDFMAPFPTDRKKALRRADEAKKGGALPGDIPKKAPPI